MPWWLAATFVVWMFLGVGLPIILKHHNDRDLDDATTPVLMLFESLDFNTSSHGSPGGPSGGFSQIKVSMENETAVFREQKGEFWASGEIGVGVGKNGVFYGNISITIPNANANANSIDHTAAMQAQTEYGKWVAIDTRNESEASAETIEVFQRLIQRSGIFSGDVLDEDEDVRHITKALEMAVGSM